jgi:general secretion pathway protein H
MVVLFIMGLGLAIALPAVSRGLEGLSLTAASREAAAVYRGVREEAVARQETKLVLITSEGDRLAIRWDGHERVLPPGVRLGAVRPENLRDAEGRIAIEFYPDGSASGGDLQVEGRPGRPPLWVMVDAVTGRVKILRSEG